MLSAEIIAIGSELLTPEKTDTNSLWLTEKLNEIGIEVKLKTIVGDDRLRLEETIRDAVRRSEIVITTGGLGPTEDDLTREISAKAINRELVYHTELETDLRERFKKWAATAALSRLTSSVIWGFRLIPKECIAHTSRRTASRSFKFIKIKSIKNRTRTNTETTRIAADFA